MAKQFVEIDPDVYEALMEIARQNGMAGVSELLEKFAKNFSNGCSVTLPAGLKVA